VNAEVRTQAQAQADLVAASAADLVGAGRRPELRTLAQTAGRSLRGRIIVVDASGRVLVDSAGPAEVGASYASRPEIRAALGGRQVQVQRNSHTLGQEILATAVPIIRGGRPVGAVRVTQSVAAVRAAVGRAELGLAVIGAIVLALGLAAGALIAAQVVRPIRRLEQVARRVAQGDLGAQARLEGSREQRSLAGSFNEMTDRMRHLLDAQRQFLADASHQLRTPLTGLRLRLEEANARGVSRGAAQELTAALAEVDRLAHTVAELLELSGGGERRATATSLELDAIAASAVSRWRAGAAAREIRLVLRRGSGGGRAWAARLDVERALDCLLENALNYSPAGSEVELLTRPGAIEVRDRGRGLAPEERERVFDRFRRGRAGRERPEGSGLGLPIARELARAWGGEVSLRAREGGGCVATLSLPAQQAAAGAGPIAAPADSVAGR